MPIVVRLESRFDGPGLAVQEQHNTLRRRSGIEPPQLGEQNEDDDKVEAPLSPPRTPPRDISVMMMETIIRRFEVVFVE